MGDCTPFRWEIESPSDGRLCAVSLLQEIERSCDQLGDDTLRGYELSEEAKYVPCLFVATKSL